MRKRKQDESPYKDAQPDRQDRVIRGFQEDWLPLDLAKRAAIILVNKKMPNPDLDVHRYEQKLSKRKKKGGEQI